jgi:DNA-binding IclR family transcriptional regulator
VRREVLGQAHPFLGELSRELGETVDLSILDGDRVTFLDQVVAPQRLRAVSAVGESFPLHCCAPGKAVLAVLPPPRLAAAMPARLTAMTSHTITSRAALRLELGQVRVDGVAYDREEHTDGVCAVGAVIDPADHDPLAVSIPMPVQRFHGREAELAAALLATCARIRADLGRD